MSEFFFEAVKEPDIIRIPNPSRSCKVKDLNQRQIIVTHKWVIPTHLQLIGYTLPEPIKCIKRKSHPGLHTTHDLSKKPASHVSTYQEVCNVPRNARIDVVSQPLTGA
jgi:hypothetical protein